MGTSGTVDKDEEIRQIDSFEQELYANQDLKIVAAKFLEGLKNMGQKVILVLDELNNFKEDELFKEFVEYILKPVAIDRESNVRIVIAVDDQKYNSWKLSDLKPESVCEVMLSTDQNDDQLIALAAEAFRLPRRAELDHARKTAKSEEDLLEAAKLLFRLNQPAGKGLGRLQILKTIEEICKCDRPKRMR